MDLDEISRRVNEVKLGNKGDQKLFIKPEELKDGKERVANFLVARVISPKAMNRETFRSQIPCIMQLKRKVEIEFVGYKTFVLEFTSMLD